MTFKHSPNLRNHHIKVHGGVLTYPCEDCDLSFNQRGSLRTHKRTHSEASYPCDQCEKVFSVAFSLRIHQRNHSGKDPLACKQCGILFKEKHTLENHKENNHETLHLYKRKLQKRKLSNNDANLAKNRNALPLSCDQCEKIFQRLEDLEMHKKCHISVIFFMPKSIS